MTNKQRRRTLQLERYGRLECIHYFTTRTGHRGLVRSDGSFIALPATGNTHRLLTSALVNKEFDTHEKRRVMLGALSRIFRNDLTRLP